MGLFERLFAMKHPSASPKHRRTPTQHRDELGWAATSTHSDPFSTAQHRSNIAQHSLKRVEIAPFWGLWRRAVHQVAGLPLFKIHFTENTASVARAGARSGPAGASATISMSLEYDMQRPFIAEIIAETSPDNAFCMTSSPQSKPQIDAQPDFSAGRVAR